MSRIMAFESELRALLNRHSAENSSDTPDFILAQYLLASLNAFDGAVRNRDVWYGRRPDAFGRTRDQETGAMVPDPRGPCTPPEGAGR